MKQKKDLTKEIEKENKKPGNEHLPATDPQEYMEGPISSLMHKTGEGFDTTESKDHADKRKEDHM